MKTIVEFKDVTKAYGTGEHRLLAADHLSFTIGTGEFAVILGLSGAGKSTLLNLLGGMDFATGGEILVNGKNIVGLSDSQLTEYRAKHVGFVFQFYNLIPTLTALDNVALTRSVVKVALNPAEVL